MKIVAASAAVVAVAAFAGTAAASSGGEAAASSATKTSTDSSGPVAVPIPVDPRNDEVAAFIGDANATTRGPIPSDDVPQDPYLAPNGTSSTHDDAYGSNTYDFSGPSGRGLTETTGYTGAEAITTTEDSAGDLVDIAETAAGTSTLQILDPTTLGLISSYSLPAATAASALVPGGGVYFYLDNENQVVVPARDGDILVIGISGTTMTLDDTYDVSSYIGDGTMTSAMPDWDGNIWFVTSNGIVGFVDPSSGDVETYSLPPGESIIKSLSVDETGVYIVSDYALYKFTSSSSGDVEEVWREAYDRGTGLKPGQLDQGSGTSPTLIGSLSSTDGGYVAVNDNAEPQMDVNIYSRTSGALVCSVPVFESGESDDFNSMIAVGDNVIAENNFGYVLRSAVNGTTTRLTPDTTPGLVDIKIDPATSSCSIKWENDSVEIPSVISKVALGNGVLYTYTHPSEATEEYSGTGEAPDAWYLTAINVRTGKTMWNKLVGTGMFYNNNYSGIFMTPGTVYVPTVAGYVRISSGS
jgi:hypothetical protein